ncbi:dihydropteroate synthase [Pseudomonas aeruginosa]|uniref:dihydropteroate synthase n=1 Tax=Pseudomonas aeruginosa TaxID=287 RepID=UPI00104333E6|nr:dihydropteroate synthase [Pseudomonas aeruginosa]
MKGWLFLVIAIVGEVIATSALKSSEGFTKLAPSAVVIIGYGIAFYFLSLVLKSIPVGVAYAGVSIDSFQPETQRYALKRGVGYLNDIQGFPDPALYPDIAEADCRLVVMHSAQRDGIATRTGHLRPEDALDEIVRFFEARVSALRRSGVAADRLILDPGMGFFLSPAPETSLHVLSNLQKLKSALGLPLLVSVSRKSFLGATVGLPVKDLGPASLAAELHAIGNGADYVRTHAPGDLRSAITFSETLAKFRSRDARDRGLDHA